MSNSDYSPKRDKNFGGKDSVTSFEPTILGIIRKTGDVPSFEPTFSPNSKIVKVGEVRLYLEITSIVFFCIYKLVNTIICIFIVLKPV